MSARPAEQNEDPLIGRLVQGRFKVLRRLAAGGMGVVYEAEQKPLGRKVALKVLELNKVSNDGTFKDRFFLEAQAVAKLGHPNTVIVHDYGSTEDGLYFIAMEYLDGGTLSRRMKEHGPLPPEEAIHIGMQVASSLRGAHEQGLVHRDLKPGNVMFAPRGGDPNFVKVLDFGLVKVLDKGQENLNLTQSGVMMGSPRYMAPEQVKAQSCDARTDIYSFGAVMYHVLTGAPPFYAGSAFEAMQHHVYTPAPPLKTTWPGCQAGPMLESVVLRCLEKDPGRRFQSMHAVTDALREAAREAGGGLSGIGSYLSPGSSSTGSDPGSVAGHIPPPMQPPSAHASTPHPSAPRDGTSGIMSRSQVQPSDQSRAPSKTMRFSSMPAPPQAPARAAASTVQPASVPTPTSAGGTLFKLALALTALMLSVGIAIGVTVLVIGSGGTPVAEPVLVEPAPIEPVLVEPVLVEPVLVAPPVAEPIPLLHVVTNPPGATVRRDGSDLGDAPLDLRIPAGDRWTILISLEGYTTRAVTLQGGQRSLTLHLEPEERTTPVPHRVRQPTPIPQPTIRRLGPATPTGPRRPQGTYSPDLDDPWSH